MSDEARTPRPDEYERLQEGIESIKRRLARLTVAVSLMTLVLILTVSAVFGNLVNYFSGDVLMWGGATAGAAVLGFALGWFARRKP
jgi:hypothetical protein